MRNQERIDIDEQRWASRVVAEQHLLGYLQGHVREVGEDEDEGVSRLDL